MSDSESQNESSRGRTRVKICGITRVEDALSAASLGVDAIGFAFYEPSPRYIEPSRAKAIADALPPFITKVGFFVNAEPRWVGDVKREVGLDLIQFHGEESLAQCEQVDGPYMKVLPVKPDTDLKTVLASYPSASAIMLDTWQPHLRGGTGKTFDWGLVPNDSDVPIVLAGGLNADNVGEAIETVRPHAVDVSGGVEVSKGIKCPAKMAAFVREVNRANDA